MNELSDISKCKAIIAFEFKTELLKLRNKECSSSIGDAFTQLEIELQKKLKRLENGEDIKSVVPDFKYHNELL